MGGLAPADRAVEVLLWDCDGVLQHARRDWGRYLDEIGGAGFAQRVFTAELPALRGERTMRAALTELLAAEESGPPVTVDGLLSIWEHVEIDDEAWAVLYEVRRLGVRCYLATNQHDHRTAFLRQKGYDARVEGGYYSCELGARKPEPAFFERVLADLRIAPAESHRVGFVDDLADNVETARRLGIRAVQHDPASGAAGLVSALAPLVPQLDRPGPRGPGPGRPHQR